MTERDVATLAGVLAAQRDVRAAHDFRARLRAELLTAPVAFAAPPRRLGWWRHAVAAAVAVAVALGGSGAAAASSLPGEPAFVLKRAFEEVQLTLAPNDAARASLALEIAERRLADLWRVNTRPDLAEAVAAAYSEAVARVSTQVDRLRLAPSAPARDEALERARDAGARAVEQLYQLGETLPLPAQKGIERAIERHQELRERDVTPADAPGRTPKPEKTAPGRPAEAPGRGPASPPRR